LREVAASGHAEVALNRWHEQGEPMMGEIALIEKINEGRRRALSMSSRIAGIIWCKDAESGRADERAYEVIFSGARRRDAIWLTRAQVREGAARRDAAALAGALGGAEASHGELNEIDEVTAWLDEADVSRWEPNTFSVCSQLLHASRREASTSCSIWVGSAQRWACRTLRTMRTVCSARSA
jgi:hypothetical protein